MAQYLGKTVKNTGAGVFSLQQNWLTSPKEPKWSDITMTVQILEQQQQQQSILYY